MKISVLTIFPEMLEPLKHSILGRAAQNGLIQLEIINIRIPTTTLLEAERACL